MKQANAYATALDRYLEEISGAAQLSQDEESNLLERTAKGDAKAEEKIAKAYLKKVVSIAKSYHVEGVSFEDLINEGNIGLMNAIRKYRAESKVPFAVYAARHIRESINSSLASRHELVLKPSVGKAVRGKIARAVRTFRQKNERRPEISEIAAIVGMPEQQVMDIIQSSHTSRSIDVPIRRGGNVAMADIIADKTAATTADSVDSERIRELINDSASTLGEREILVATDYYGLGGVQLNMSEIAEKYGLKRERVRQIRDTATRKLRKILRDFNRE